MNRNTRVLIVLGVAVVTAALASFGVFWAIRSRPPKVVETASMFAVVAAHSIELGSNLTAEDVRVIPWPAHNPMPGMFKKVEEVVNRGVVAPVVENEPITENKLAPVGAGAGFSTVIRQGMRAMSVKVNDVIGVAGYVVPGTRVDVLVTIRSDRDTASRVVVSNVQVLTAGTRYDAAKVKEEGKPIQSSVVTLLVSPSDAERIALAQTEGQIMLALRHPLDQDATSTPGIHTAELMAMSRVAAPAPRPGPKPAPKAGPKPVNVIVEVAPAPPPPPPSVETIKAGKRDKELIR